MIGREVSAFRPFQSGNFAAFGGFLQSLLCKGYALGGERKCPVQTVSGFDHKSTH